MNGDKLIGESLAKLKNNMITFEYKNSSVGVAMIDFQLVNTK